MKTHTAVLHCLLYRSVITPTESIQCVADIVKTARSFNKEHGITGILIFDGQRFCQYIEGPPTAMQLLTDSIMRDPRHTEFTTLLSAPTSQRRFGHWAMAYVVLDDEEPLDNIAKIPRENALEHLQTLLPLLDAF